MANPETPNTNVEDTINIPTNVQNALTKLQWDIQASKDVEASKEAVFTSLNQLASDNPNLKQDCEDIKTYIRYIQYTRTRNANTVIGESLVNQDRLLLHRCVNARCVSPWEQATSGEVHVAITDRANQSVNAAGWVTKDYGKTIPAGEEFDRDSVERGRKILGKIPSKSSDTWSSDSGGQTVDNTESKVKENAWVQEIEQTLKEINPETLDKAITISEQFINQVKDPQTQATLRGVHGAIILNMLRQAGHNLMIRDGKVTIEPKPGVSVVDLETKLQTLVDTRRLSIDTLKTWLLYSSPAFKKYATELGITKDSQGNVTISPQANGKAFLAYVSELKKAGQNSPDITSLLASASMLESVDFQQAIKWFQDLGQVSAFAEKNPGMLAAVSTTLNTTSSQGSSWTPAKKETNTTITGQLAWNGVTGGKVTSTLSLAGQGLTQGFGDLMKLGKGDPIATLGIGAALFYGVYKMFKQFGFFGGIAGFLGLGALNNWEKIGGNFSGAWKTVEEILDKASDKIDQIRWKTWSDVTPPVQPAELTDAPKELTDDQVYLRDKIMQNASVIESVDRLSQMSKKDKKPEIGTMEDYLEFIEKDLKDVPLNKLFPEDHKESIFYDDFNTPISVPDKLSKKMLKKVLRAYLGGANMAQLSGEWDALGASDKDNFLKTYGITTDDIKNKNFSDILARVHQKRKESNGSATPSTPIPTPQITSTPSTTPPVTPSDVILTFWNKEMKIGDWLRVNTSQAIVYDAQGGNPALSSLKKDKSQKAYLELNNALKIAGPIEIIQGVQCVKVTYTNTEMYIPIKSVKTYS
jgi:hypothetical protein